MIAGEDLRATRDLIELILRFTVTADPSLRLSGRVCLAVGTHYSGLLPRAQMAYERALLMSEEHRVCCQLLATAEKLSMARMPRLYYDSNGAVGARLKIYLLEGACSGLEEELRDLEDTLAVIPVDPLFCSQ